MVKKNTLNLVETQSLSKATMVRTRSGRDTTMTTMTTTTPPTVTTPSTIPDVSAFPTGTCIVCGVSFRVGACAYGHSECCDTFLTLTDHDEYIYIPDGVRANFATIVVDRTEYIENWYGGENSFRTDYITYQLAVPADVSNVKDWIEDRWTEICDYSGISYDSMIQYIY